MGDWCSALLGAGHWLPYAAYKLSLWFSTSSTIFAASWCIYPLNPAPH